MPLHKYCEFGMGSARKDSISGTLKSDISGSKINTVSNLDIFIDIDYITICSSGYCFRKRIIFFSADGDGCDVVDVSGYEVAVAGFEFEFIADEVELGDIFGADNNSGT